MKRNYYTSILAATIVLAALASPTEAWGGKKGRYKAEGVVTQRCIEVRNDADLLVGCEMAIGPVDSSDLVKLFFIAGDQLYRDARSVPLHARIRVWTTPLGERLRVWKMKRLKR